MSVPGQSGYDFTLPSIIQNAPNRSGVYGIYNAEWIYFGESNDIQRRLLEHLNDTTGCIMRNGPVGFAFETIPDPAERLARQNGLIRQFRPACNQMLG